MALRQMIDQSIDDASSDDHDAIVSCYPSAFAPLLVRDEPALSVVERNVILLARRDPLGSLEAPGLIERAFAWVFGARSAAHRLADPRLETLRRAAVVAHHRRHLPDAVAVELRALGFGARRIAAIEALALG